MVGCLAAQPCQATGLLLAVTWVRPRLSVVRKHHAWMPRSVLSWGLFAVFVWLWEMNLWLLCASAAAPFGMERKKQQLKNMEIHFSHFYEVFYMDKFHTKNWCVKNSV